MLLSLKLPRKKSDNDQVDDSLNYIYTFIYVYKKRGFLAWRMPAHRCLSLQSEEFCVYFFLPSLSSALLLKEQRVQPPLMKQPGERGMGDCTSFSAIKTEFLLLCTPVSAGGTNSPSIIVNLEVHYWSVEYCCPETEPWPNREGIYSISLWFWSPCCAPGTWRTKKEILCFFSGFLFKRCRSFSFLPALFSFRSFPAFEVADPYSLHLGF